MFKKIFLISLILAIIIGFTSLSYAYQAIALSDKELDNVYAAGFDFNLNVAYAFRAAVLNQSNIAVITTLNGNIHNPTINSLNLASLNNQANSALASQRNIAAVIAESGNIINAVVNNTNTINLENNSVGGSGPQGVGPGGSGPQGVGPGGSGPQGVGPAANASAVVTQTNLAAVIALDGNIGDPVGSVTGAKINNTNLVSLSNQENSAIASQVNVAVVMASGNIVNTAINNTANFNDIFQSSGGTEFTSLLPSGMFTEFKHKTKVINHSPVSQWNITFVKQSFKNDKVKGKVVNIISNFINPH